MDNVEEWKETLQKEASNAFHPTVVELETASVDDDEEFCFYFRGMTQNTLTQNGALLQRFLALKRTLEKKYQCTLLCGNVFMKKKGDRSADHYSLVYVIVTSKSTRIDASKKTPMSRGMRLLTLFWLVTFLSTVFIFYYLHFVHWQNEDNKQQQWTTIIAKAWPLAPSFLR
jgi:hypothetical protein